MKKFSLSKGKKGKKGPAFQDDQQSSVSMQRMLDEAKLDTIALTTEYRESKNGASSTSSKVSKTPSPVNTASEVIDRTQLFDDLKSPHFFPMDKVINISTFCKSKNIALHFTGVEQLTDMYFGVLFFLKTQKNLKLDVVKEVDLTGCYNITDQGLMWLSNCFAGLQKVIIRGCKQITEEGLNFLLNSCSQLSTIDITATNVAILPRKLARLNVIYSGCPIISPSQEIMKEQGLQIMEDQSTGVAITGKDASYAERTSSMVNTVKITVIRAASVTKSLIKCLDVQKTMDMEPVEYLSGLKLGNMNANVIETDKCTMDLFIHRRTAYVITYEESSAKTVADELFSIIAHVLSKDNSANFLLLGMKTSENCADPDEVCKLVKDLALKTRKRMKSLSENLSNLSGIDFSEQFDLVQSEKFIFGLDFIKCSSFLLDMQNKLKEQLGSFLKKLQTSAETAHQIHSLFDDIAKPLYLYLLSDAVNSTLQGGAVALNNTQSHITKTMELHHMLGRAVCITFHDGSYIATRPDWLAKILSAILTPSSKKNEMLLSMVSDDVQVVTQDDIKARLQKVISEDQVSAAVGMLSQMPVGIISSVYCAYKHLPSAPPVTLKEYFPQDDKVAAVKYKFEFNHSVDSIVIHHLADVCSKLRRPSALWQWGIMMQDGYVDSLLHITHVNGVSTLTLISQSPLIAEKVNTKIWRMVWQSALQYKLITHYILRQMGLVCKITVDSKLMEIKDEVRAVICKHAMVEVADNVTCQNCGTHSRASGLLWRIYKEMTPSHMEDDLLMMKKCTNYHRDGSILKSTGADSTVFFLATMNAFEQNQVKFTILETDNQNISISLSGRSFNEVLRYQTLTGEVTGGTETKSQKSPASNGETITIKIDSVVQGDKSKSKVQILKEGQVIGMSLIPSGFYVPAVHLGNVSNAVVMAHSLHEASQLFGELEVGMRLEAVDRLNVHLICVATIADINTETDEILIHFDGWTSRYDYWTKFSSSDLHPVGFMEKNSHRLQRVNHSLQAPHGYHGAFTWEKYCREMKCEPVPYSLFSKEQLMDTPPDRTDSVLSACGLFSMKRKWKSKMEVMPCNSEANAVKLTEIKVIKSCSMNSDIMDFYMNTNLFFVLLPRNPAVDDFRYPSFTKLCMNKEQNVHFLCSGLRTEILHFVNSTGLKIETFCPKLDYMKEWASFLFNCYIGLMLQNGILPYSVDKIIPSLKGQLQTEKIGMLEKGMQKMMYLYLLWIMHYISGTEKTPSYQDSILKFVHDVTENKEASAQVNHSFHGFGGSGAIRCMGHHLSVNLPTDSNITLLNQYADYLQFLQKIDMQNHELEQISDDFFVKFCKAEEINLSHNRIVQLPSGMSSTLYLSILYLNNNQLTFLPDELSRLAGTLEILNISNNPFGDLPKCVLKLIGLTHLSANNIGKVSTLEGIKEFKNLKVLCIGYNILESIPDELKDLSLEELNLSGVPWFPNLITERINPTLQRFKAVLDEYCAYRQLSTQKKDEIFRSVDKDSNGTLENEELQELNTILIDLFPRFGKGSLAYPNTGGVPNVIFEIRSLKKLSLQYHALTEITDAISQLSELNSLDVSCTNIVGLSPVAGNLPLKELHLQYCPHLKTPPKEVVNRGFSAVYGYLKRLSQGAVSCRRTKLMMVGLGGAGKTSLVESLMSSHGTADLDYEEAITDGIDICEWKVPVPGEEGIHFSVWDFAGQTVYYNTHQFFLSNRAVYFLVWNIRLGFEHAGLDFWLSSIACHAPKAPILIIGTHCDKVEKSTIPQKELQRNFPQIKGFFFVSSYTGEGIGKLQKKLVEVALEQKYMGEKVPEAWLELEKGIRKFRESKQKVDLLPWSEVELVADQYGILDYNETIQAIEFLHDLGSVIFFNTEFLRGYVVIYPQWIVDVMACIVTVHVGPIQEGKLCHKDMAVVWQKYPANLHPWLLRLTEEFDLTFPLSDEEANLVPCLLPDTEMNIDWPAVNTEKGEKENKMIYRFKYLPAGLFNRAQVRLHGYSDGGQIWKKGMLLKKNKHSAVIIQNTKSEVTVKAQGYKPENILFLVHEVFEALIEESYTGVDYDFLIPCIECQNMNLTEPSMFSASRIYRAVELHAPFLQCDNMFHTLSITELQALMPPDKTTDFDNHLRRNIQELQDINEDINTNICFVFCRKDVPDKENKSGLVDPHTIMYELRENGFLVSYSDNPETADLTALTLSFRAAKVILIGMSNNFCEDAQCKKMFMYIKETLRMPFLLVFLGKGTEWMKSDLGLSVSSEVFVKMNDIKRYQSKFTELLAGIKRKTDKKAVNVDMPKCFISYCWSNSKTAIDKGSKKKDGALGWGDPRKLKHFLSKAGIKCWLDIERVGGNGLFEDIANGLRKAKVMVACVSDEYANSDNCKMEFRFASCQLKIPIVVVMVGTKYMWERTEIGMLAVGNKYAKVNLQYENTSGLLEILKLVQENLSQEDEGADPVKYEKQKEASFKEILEIAERQFLRQCIQFSDSMYTAHYPRLFVIDFTSRNTKPITPDIQASKTDGEECTKSDQEKYECSEEAIQDAGTEDKDGKLCFRLMCEHEEGWHEVEPTVSFPAMSTEEEEEWLMSIAPYAARILAVLKYTNLPLQCLNTPQGKQLQQKFESELVENQDKTKGDFKGAYIKIREAVMEQDKDKVCGNLKRCHLLNGKIRWLCENHSKDCGSKTERKFQEALSIKSSLPVSTPKISKRDSSLASSSNPAPANKSSKPPPGSKQQGVFNMRQVHGAQKHPGMKRQSSQACSVM